MIATIRPNYCFYKEVLKFLVTADSLANSLHICLRIPNSQARSLISNEQKLSSLFRRFNTRLVSRAERQNGIWPSAVACPNRDWVQEGLRRDQVEERGEPSDSNQDSDCYRIAGKTALFCPNRRSFQSLDLLGSSVLPACGDQRPPGCEKSLQGSRRPSSRTRGA